MHRLSRSFSSTSTCRGISDVYSKLMRWSTTPKAADIDSDNKKLYDPTKETRSKRDEMPDDSAPRTLKVLGKPRDTKADKEWVEKTFAFEAWPTNQYKKDLTAESIENALESIKFETLEEKFQALKQLSTQLELALPDKVLLLNRDQLKQHLLKAAKHHNEKTPDAIYLNRDEFKGFNVVIENTPEELKALKLRNKRIIKEAKNAQDQKMSELLSSA